MIAAEHSLGTERLAERNPLDGTDSGIDILFGDQENKILQLSYIQRCCNNTTAFFKQYCVSSR
jgi:hypothetical protein